MTSTHEDMYEDALPRLMAAHPALFAARSFQIPSELPAGWYAIADQLCTDLESLLGAATVKWQPVQSKEKWGSWRLYWRLELDDEGKPETFNLDLVSPPDPDGVERLNQDDVQVSPTPSGYRISVLPQGELRRTVHGRVRAAETATEATCMWCGEAGVLWSNGWMHVACTRHRRQDATTLDEWRRRAEERHRTRHGRVGPGNLRDSEADDE